MTRRDVCHGCKMHLPCDDTPRGRLCESCRDGDDERAAVFTGELDAETRETWTVGRYAQAE